MNTTARKATDGIGTTHTVRVTCDCSQCNGAVGWVTPGCMKKGVTEHGMISLGLSPFGRFDRAIIMETR